MNSIDWYIIIVLIIFCLIGYWRGFFRELLTLSSFMMSIILAFVLYPILGPYVFRSMKLPIGISNLAAFVIIFLVAQIIFSIIIGFVNRIIRDKREEFPLFRKIDNFTGIIPGLINGFVVISLVILILVILPINPKLKSILNDSKTANFALSNLTAINNKVKALFVPATNDTLARIGSLTSSFVTDQSSDLDFPKDITLENDSQAEQRMLKLVNAERGRRGFKLLVLDEKLSQIAREHSEEMFKLSYFDHVSSVSGTPSDRLIDFGIQFQIAGENLAYAPNVDVAHWGLMNSPSHRANILDERYGKIGIGIINGFSWGEMYTQEFTN